MNIAASKQKIALLSARIKGVWNFYSVSNLSFKKLTPRLRYSVLPVVAGLLLVGETDPSNTQFIGEVGDYLFMDLEGNLTVLGATQGETFVNAH